MGRAEILALAVGGADEVFLVLRKVGSAALIHFAAALCTIQKPGEHTHFTHLGRTATRLAIVLNNQEHTFLDDRRLGVLKDHPVRRVIPDFLLALVGLLCSLEVYGMPQIQLRQSHPQFLLRVPAGLSVLGHHRQQYRFGKPDASMEEVQAAGWKV